MLVNMKEMLLDAEKNNYAIGSFNTPNLETLRAVIGAAEEMNTPVMINHAQGHENVIALEMIAPLMKEYAQKAKVPVCMHIDHGHDLNFCMRAVRNGFTSIMYDCSAYPLEENIKRVNQFTELAAPLGITIEAELGEMPNNMPTCVPGQEKSDLSDLSIYYTSVQDAVSFCEQTSVEALTISFGTIHGIYEGKPSLDIQRVKEIKKAVSHTQTALVMHGASGTDTDQIRAAVAAGIRKINYFTAMDTAVAPVLKEMIESAGDKPLNYSVMANVAMDVLKEKCKEAMAVFLNC